jgi:L-lactate permease
VLIAFHPGYQPIGDNIVLSALVAGIPLYILFGLLAVWRRPAWQAALAAVLSCVIVAVVGWQMPLGLSVSATTAGMAFGLWPISWIVLNAVFFHNLTIASGDFDVIRRSLTRLTADRRLQALLVAFSFGALLEGIAGFGAPVAITASILAAIGFEPVSAAVLALLANTAPVAFGSIGIPVTTLGGLTAGIIGHGTQDTNVVTHALSSMVGRQLPIFSAIIPAYLIVVLAGWRRMREVLPAVLVTGITFAVVQFLVSNFLGPELTDILAALASMGALAALLRVWRPREIWGFAPAHGTPAAAAAAEPSVGAGIMNAGATPGGEEQATPAEPLDRSGRVWRAFFMYVLLVLVILVGQMGSLPFFSGSPPGDVKTALGTPANITSDLKCGTITFKLCPKPWVGPSPVKDRQAFKFPVWNFFWPGSYELVKGAPKSLIFREKPIVAKESAYDLIYNWDFLAAAGSLVLYAGVLAFLLMRALGWKTPLTTFFVVYGRTLRQLRLPIITIAMILGIAQLMNYSGMTSTLAILMAKTGVLFPFFSAFIGMLGVFLTGSDTSSNTLFGPMQALTAKLQHINPVLTAATNSSGGVMGKMISPQNLSVGAAGVNKVGAEGEIFRRVIGYSLILTAMVGVLAMIQAYLVPGVIPVVP